LSEAVILGARIIEALGGVVIAYAMAQALAVLLAGRLTNAALDRSRRRLASGAVSALGLMTAAALLKTINLRSWSAIGMFAVVLALRAVVKRAFAAEARSAEPG
jgi:uncharacterized membrane protein